MGELDDRQRTGAITLANREADGETSGRPALEANIILIAHPDNARLGTRYRLVSGSTLEIGRADSVEISLPEVRSISRSHARLRYQGRKVTVEDAGSTNGTFVNDQRVDGPALLRSGDRFQVGSVHFKFLHEQDVEHAYHEAIYQMVMRDGLTEALNQRKFHEELAREYARAERHDRPLTLVLFDLDSFKEVNDTHGHLCGDMVLKQVAASVREHIRAEQVFARMPEAVGVFIVPPSYRDLKHRLEKRGTDGPLEIRRRLSVSHWEIERYRAYRYVIVNDDVVTAGQALAAILLEKRHQRERQQVRVEEILADFERSLAAELPEEVHGNSREAG